MNRSAAFLHGTRLVAYNLRVAPGQVIDLNVMTARMKLLVRAAVRFGITNGCRIRDEGWKLDFDWRFA